MSANLTRETGDVSVGIDPGTGFFRLGMARSHAFAETISAGAAESGHSLSPEVDTTTLPVLDCDACQLWLEF